MEEGLFTKWQPPSASTEMEDFISCIEEHFDKWKPPKMINDNLYTEERNLIKEIKSNDDVIYSSEVKGPSFSNFQTPNMSWKEKKE